jgi:hypothetical protein
VSVEGINAVTELDKASIVTIMDTIDEVC